MSNGLSAGNCLTFVSGGNGAYACCTSSSTLRDVTLLVADMVTKDLKAADRIVSEIYVGWTDASDEQLWFENSATIARDLEKHNNHLREIAEVGLKYDQLRKKVSVEQSL